MTYNEKVGKNLIVKARQTDLVHFLRSRHPKSLQYAAHPDKPGKFCWRGTVHDSITFFTSDHNGIDLWKYYRWSNRESGDGIDYLMKYEGYSFPNAVKALAYFTDPFEKVMEVEEDTFRSDRESGPSFSPYPEYQPGDPLYIPDGVDEED